VRLRPRTPAPILVAAGAALVLWTVEASGLRFNASPSVPVGVYRLVDAPVERGALVAACLRERYGRLGRERGYLRRGSCPGGAAPVVKRIGASGGDHVQVSDEGVFVNGGFLEEAAPPTDSRERPLVPWPPGSFRLASEELWLYSDRSSSWDSRFFGPVRRPAVLGVARPIWTSAGGTANAREVLEIRR
jgi:conjugative transfer signal peptidase TraF